MAAVHPVPPSWKDLGKSASDLLNKDFPLAGNALEVKTRAPNGVAFKVAGLRDAKSAAIAGDLEAKYSDVKNGVTLTQTWTTSNVLKTQVELENQVAKGLKLDIQGHLLPATQGKSAYVTAIYRQPSVHTRALLDVFKGPTFTADAVIGRDGFLLGAESTYSVPSGAVTRYALGLGYAAPTYTVTLHGLANLSVFSASYYHKVSKDVEAGAKAIWDSKSTASQVGLEVGTKCYLDNTAFVKAKINSVGVAALGYTQALRPGVKASFGLAVDTAKLGEASHKVGTSLTFEASVAAESTPYLLSSNTIATAATTTTTAATTSSSTRVATILCTVFPVLIVMGMIGFGALWCRHRRHSRRKQQRAGGRAASTIVIEEEGLPPRLYHPRHHLPPPPLSPPLSIPPSSEYPPPRRRRTARLSEPLRRLRLFLLLEPKFPHPQQISHVPGRRVPSKATEPLPSSSSSSSSSSLSSPGYFAPPAGTPEWARCAEATGQAVNIEPQEEEDGCGRGETTLRSNGLPRLPPPVYEP